MINLQFNEETKCLKSSPPQTPKKVFDCSSEMKHLSSGGYVSHYEYSIRTAVERKEGGGLNINSRQMC